MLLLPTKAKLVAIPVKRAAVVENTTTIDFEEGTLKQVDISKPSEVLEIVSLPVEILKAIVAIPAELIQLKIDTTNQERSEEHTSELQSLMRISYAVFCLKKKNISEQTKTTLQNNT